MSTVSTKKVINNYSFFTHHKIGAGCSSQVYKGVNDKTNQPVAIKVVAKMQSKKELNIPLADVQINWLKHLKNEPHILQFICAIQTQNNIYIITQLCQGGSLSDLIHLQLRLSESKAITYMQQIISGYMRIAAHKIIHRDLKPINMFIRQDQVKIGDFGFAIDSGLCRKSLDQNVGSPIYMPYETLSENYYSYKSDIWALGVIFLQMLIGKTPWKSKTERDLKRQLTLFKIQEIIPIGISQRSREFLFKTLQKDQHQRMSLQQLNEFAFAEVSGDEKSSTFKITSMTKLKNTLQIHTKSSANLNQQQSNFNHQQSNPTLSKNCDSIVRKSTTNLINHQATYINNKHQIPELSFMKKSKFDNHPIKCSLQNQSSGSTQASNKTITINIIKPSDQISEVKPQSTSQLFTIQNQKYKLSSTSKSITDFHNYSLHKEKMVFPHRKQLCPQLQYISSKKEFTSPYKQIIYPNRSLSSPKIQYLSSKKLNIPQAGQLLQKYRRYQRAESYVFKIRSKVQNQKNLANRSQVYSKQKTIETAEERYTSISKDKDSSYNKNKNKNTGITNIKSQNVSNAKQTISLQIIPEAKIIYYEKQILCQLQAQINYFRFIFKIFKQINDGLKTAIGTILSLKSNLLFLIFKKIQQIKELKFVKVVTKQNKQNFIKSKSYSNLIDVVNGYLIRYQKQTTSNCLSSFKCQNQFMSNLTNAISLLYKNILKIQHYQSQLNNKKQLVLMLQNLIQLFKLFLLQREQNWDRFFLKSNMAKLVQHTTPIYINKSYWRSVKKRVQQLQKI